MPRKPRLSIPGALHHVMARGIEGRPIFNDDEDRIQFLSLLSEGIARSGYKCYAWVLMKNHYHLLLRVNEKPLYVLMRILNSKYARWFRKKNKNRGYLFQDRFKSLITQDQGYAEQLVRYIHLNPVRAGICMSIGELDHYPWSGHAVIAGRKQYSFQDTADVLRRFGGDRKTAVHRYREFMSAGISDTDSKNFIELLQKSNHEITDRHDPQCWVIGDQAFVKAALEHDRLNRLRIASYRKTCLTVKSVVDTVAQQLKMEPAEIEKRGRSNDRSTFRKIVAAHAHRICGIPITDIARYFGIGNSSVSRMLDDGERLAKEHKIAYKALKHPRP